jgi:hypothetical protein
MNTESMKVAHPVGLRVTEVRMMTKLELEAEGWEESWGGFPVMLIFEDGSKIYASSDPEGNDAGCIFGLTKDGESIIISPLDDQMIKEGKTA